MLGLAGIALLAPMAGYGPSVLHAKKTPPMYARAVARMKFGKYSEAEWEIIHELEKCEDDFEGWMMLADLYANNFNDLPEAEQTILEICDQPKTTPSQLSIALHRLADWHLQRAGDPEAARRDAANDLPPPAGHAPGAHGPAPHQPTARLRGRTPPAAERGPDSPAGAGRYDRRNARRPPSQKRSGTRPPRRPMPASRSSSATPTTCPPGKGWPGCSPSGWTSPTSASSK